MHSSETLSWQGIFVEQRFHPPGEYSYPAFSGHLICLHHGPPSSLEQVRDGRSFACMMPPGGIQIIPAGTACAWRHRVGATFTALMLAPDVIQQIASDLHQNRVELLAQCGIQDPSIEHLCLALLAELAAGGPSGRIFGDGLATAIAARLISTYSHAPRPLLATTRGLSATSMRRILSLIDDRLAEDLSMAELAAEAGLSPSHFAGLFRLSVGVSPYHYIVQRRVERAQSLLQTSKLSIAEIANAVGFYDHSHLVRQMRRVLGVTPKYLRDHAF